MKIPPKARHVLSLFPQALVVGGYVRDSILGVESKDVDIEVYGEPIGNIEGKLSCARFEVNAVGRSFGVLKVGNDIDVSVPRRENKIGVGHKGFEMLPDPRMGYREAAARRDFTMNSLAMDADGRIFDHFGGRDDLLNGVLRHTSAAFSEDPLRVLRGMQFASRFDMEMAQETAELCEGMDLGELPKERIWAEWKKWAGGLHPSRGLELLADCGQLPEEIWSLIGCPQDPEWHPEGDVFIHTGMVVDQAARIAVGLLEQERLVLLFAALCHDFGKPEVTEKFAGRWRARGHCETGVKPAAAFLEDIGAPQWLVERVLPLIKDHLVHAGGELSDRAIRRLAVRLHPATIADLSRLVEADHSGRHPLPPGNPLESLTVSAWALAVVDAKPKPVILGRHLISLGMEPGPAMGVLLAEYFEAQLDGEFDDMEGWVRWRTNTNRKPTSVDDRG